MQILEKQGGNLISSFFFLNHICTSSLQSDLVKTVGFSQKSIFKMFWKYFG